MNASSPSKTLWVALCAVLPAIAIGRARNTCWLTLGAALPVIAIGIVGLCVKGRTEFDRMRANWWAGLIATFASAFALTFGCVTFGEHPCANQYSTQLKAGLLISWTLVPPVCLLFENMLFKPGFKDVADFRYEQDLKSKVWLALVTALTALYFGRDILGRG